MKKMLTLLLLASLTGCGDHTADHNEPVVLSCGFDDLPHEHEPVLCGENPWTKTGHCCTWVTDEGEEECITSWCYNKHVCGWMVNQRSCNPKG